MIRSEYALVKLEPERVYIRDLDRGAMSVTNDAERVVQHLYSVHGNRRMFYQDSEGDWNELIHKNGIFEDFGWVDCEPTF